MNKKSKISILLMLLSSFLITPIFISEGVNDPLSLPQFNPQIDEQVQEIMEQNYIPTVTTAVIRNNSIIWAKGYGEQQDRDLIHMTGSVTKTITATAVFQAYEEGLIQLDDDVNEYLPFSFRHPNYTSTPITIRMLLAHRSGLDKDSEMYEYGTAEDALQRLGWENPFDWLPFPYWIEEHLTPTGSLYDPATWTPYEPGTYRTYSNFGYNVLGYVLGLAAGKPIWEYVQEKIFDPLEMDSTGYNFTSFDESQLAIPYEYMFELDPESTGNKAYPHYNYLGYPSGAIRSNVYDLAKFLLIHMHKGLSNGTRILEELSIQIMHDLRGPWLEPGDECISWGGWGGNEGDMYGFHTKAYCYYDGNTTVPYGVITFVNQGMDEARDACFALNSLLRQYVHEYDQMECKTTDGFTIFVSIVCITILAIIIRRKNK